jgi:flagellar motor switch protein FliN/FliY
MPVHPRTCPIFSPNSAPKRQAIDLLNDVELNVKIELGRANMLIEDVLRLGQGSVVELDKLAGDPVDVLVNDRLVARGEVLVLNDNFCVRISEIVSGVEEEVVEAGAA